MVGAPHEIAIALFFISGLVMMLIMACVASGVWSLQKRRYQRKADELGVKVDFSSGESSIDAYGIEGCGYCVGFIIIIVLGAMGISLPIILPGDVQQLLFLSVLLVFGSVFWGATIWGFYYISRISRKFQKILDEAPGVKEELLQH
ncbi:MAG: hypothetical protein ACFFDP_05340 [Promethearchaeota archaeon]